MFRVDSAKSPGDRLVDPAPRGTGRKDGSLRTRLGSPRGRRRPGRWTSISLFAQVHCSGTRLRTGGSGGNLPRASTPSGPSIPSPAPVLQRAAPALALLMAPHPDLGGDSSPQSVGV